VAGELDAAAARAENVFPNVPFEEHKGAEDA
jgi:hypothetical protein